MLQCATKIFLKMLLKQVVKEIQAITFTKNYGCIIKYSIP